MGEEKIKICASSRFTYNCLAQNGRAVGGAERDLANILRSLVDSGRFEVTLISETHGAPSDCAGVRVVDASMPTWKPKLLAYCVYLWRLWRASRAQRADIYFAKGCCLPMLVLTAVARRQRVPAVFRFASYSELDPTALNASKNNRTRLILRLFDAALRAMKVCICQTQDQAELFEKKFGVKPPVIYNMLELTPMEASDVTASLPERKTILWLGRCHSVKRPRLFLDLARQLPDLDFTMIASRAWGEEALFDEVAAQAAALPNVRFIDGVLPNAVARYYREARVFVMTSVYEGFPNTMAEALSQGVPVLSYSFAVSGWTAQGSPNAAPAAGFVCGGDDDTLRALTTRLMTDDDFWRSCAAAGLEKVAAMTPAPVAREYCRLFADIAGK